MVRAFKSISTASASCITRTPSGNTAAVLHICFHGMPRPPALPAYFMAAHLGIFDQLFRNDLEPGEMSGPECCRDRDISSVPAARDHNATDFAAGYVSHLGRTKPRQGKLQTTR